MAARPDRGYWDGIVSPIRDGIRSLKGYWDGVSIKARDFMTKRGSRG